MVTLVFARLEDTVSLWRALGDRLRPALARYDAVMRASLGDAGGYEVKREGSSFFFAFQRADTALRAALDAQEAVLAEPWHQTVPELKSNGALPVVRVAIGIHAGVAVQRLDPLTGRTDYLGPAVNAAARIGQLARGLQILVSQEALLEASERGFSVEDPEREGAWMALHGAHMLRGVTRPVDLVELRPKGMARAVVPSTPSIRSLTAGLPQHNLPPARGSFVGRSAEMVLLEATVGAGEQLVVLAGPGGAGKTRTATEIARTAISGRTGRRFPGGAWFVDLGEAKTAEGVCAAISAALHTPLEGDDPALFVSGLLRALGGAVLILDEADQTAELIPALVQGWRVMAPDTLFLVTSRLTVHATGVRLVNILPLPTPPPHGARNQLQHNPALQLMFDRIRERGKRAWELVPSGFVDAAAELVRRLDGLPLAVELAADLLAQQTAEEALAQILAWNRYGLVELSTQGPGADQVRVVIERTWLHLPMWARVATAQVSVFRGPFSVEAAEAVILLVGVLGAPPPLDALEFLVDLHLILPASTTHDGENLLHVPTLVSAFVLGRTDAQPPMAPASTRRDAAERRHMLWYAHQGSAEELEQRRGDTGGAALFRMHLERENLMAALRRAARIGAAEQAIGAARALVDLLGARGPLHQLDEVLETVMALPDPPADLMVRLVTEAAEPLMCSGALQRARAALARAMAVAGATGDDEGRARLAVCGALVFAEQGLLDRAMVAATRASELSRQASDEVAMAAAWQVQAETFRRIGRMRDGLERAELASSLAEAHGDPLLIAETGLTLGRLMAAEGHLTDSRARLTHVASSLRRLGRARRAAGASVALAEVNLLIGRADEAETTLRQALPVLQDCGDRVMLRRGLEQMSRILERIGRHDDAKSALEQAARLAAAPQRGDPQQYATTTRMILADPRPRS